MNEVALNLESMNPEQKVNFSSNVNTQISSQGPDFPGSAQVLLDLTTARTALSDAIAAELAAETQLAVARMDLALADKAHDLQLKVTATFAEQVTNFDGAKLESGGFTLAKPPLPIGPLPAPINLRSVAGAMPGTATVSSKAVRGGKTYQAQCAPAASGPWTDVYNGTRPRFLATGLTSGVLYYFRMAVTGAAGQSPWSDISEKRAP
jgi:hypothetical protein